MDPRELAEAAFIAWDLSLELSPDFETYALIRADGAILRTRISGTSFEDGDEGIDHDATTATLKTVLRMVFNEAVTYDTPMNLLKKVLEAWKLELVLGEDADQYVVAKRNGKRRLRACLSVATVDALQETHGGTSAAKLLNSIVRGVYGELCAEHAHAPA